MAVVVSRILAGNWSSRSESRGWSIEPGGGSQEFRLKRACRGALLECGPAGALTWIQSGGANLLVEDA
jgi:hypothetical protein